MPFNQTDEPPSSPPWSLSGSHSSPVNSKTLRVVIVEDDPVIRRMLAEVIDDAPALTVEAAYSDAESAFSGIQDRLPDVVVMDIQLPKMSGVDCTRLLKERFPDLQIVIFTVFADTDQILKALKVGASGYLLKRSSPEEIVTAVRQVWEGGAPMSPGIARKVVEALRTPPVSAAREQEDKQKQWRLTTREAEILDYLAKGFSGKEMAAQLGVEEVTIRFHLKNIYSKLHVRSRTEAIVTYLK